MKNLRTHLIFGRVKDISYVYVVRTFYLTNNLKNNIWKPTIYFLATLLKLMELLGPGGVLERRVILY